ncbi:MAG TPA: DNA primase [Saprospiraceae bacterium]|nr:DNA primase [Saprospiraceae bacterium]
MISNASIQQVIDTARIEDVVRDYVSLRNRGSNMIGLCPFHKEKTPSFSISPGKNIFKCFGCSKGGSPVQFVMEIEQLSFPESIRFLAKKYNIKLEETASSKENIEEQHLLESLNVINNWVKTFYQDQLWNTDLGKSLGFSYFKDRGFLEATIRKFELGMTPEFPDGLTKAAIENSFNIDLLKKLGLTNSYDKDFFRDRVMFPLHNPSGKTIGFAGRILNSDAKIAKYVNSPESEVYHKSKTLFGLHLAKSEAKKRNKIILVEGYTDVMSLSQSGIENVVASSGTALTEQQAQLIKRYTENVIILYDGDQAGINAAMRGIDILLKENLNVQIALIPGNHDPDSYLRSIGTESFEKFLETESKDFILFKANILFNESKQNPILKATATKEIVSTIAKIDDPIKRSIYIQETANLMSLPEGNLIELCNQIIKEELKNQAFKNQREALRRDEEIIRELGSETQQVHQQETISTGVYKDEFQEKEIVRILMTAGTAIMEAEQISVTQYILENIEDILPYFEHPDYASIIREIIQQYSNGILLTDQYYSNHQDAIVKNLYYEFSFPKYELSKNWSDKYGLAEKIQNQFGIISEEEINQVLKHIKVRKFDIIIKELDQKIIEQKDSMDEIVTLLKIREEYKSVRNSLWLEVSHLK